MMTYLITGLRVKSEFELWTADPIGTEKFGGTDVTIRFCEEIGSPKNKHFESEWIEAADKDFLFRPKTGLTYRIRGGDEISISRAADIADRDINLFLVGSAWGVLCHQRKLLPFHCSAIQSSGCAFAFTGPSGAGKSTLAAGLSRRGYVHLCDDVSIVDVSNDHMPFYHMPKGLKLWRDAADALGLECGEVVSSDARMDKFHVSFPRNNEELPSNIAALYVLAETDAKSPSISRLRGAKHFQELISSIYRFEWLSLIRDPGEVFVQTAELSKKLKLFRFSRPRNMACFDEGLNLLEAHMAEIAGRELQ